MMKDKLNSERVNKNDFQQVDLISFIVEVSPLIFCILAVTTFILPWGVHKQRRFSSLSLGVAIVIYTANGIISKHHSLSCLLILIWKELKLNYRG